MRRYVDNLLLVLTTIYKLAICVLELGTLSRTFCISQDGCKRGTIMFCKMIWNTGEGLPEELYDYEGEYWCVFNDGGIHRTGFSIDIWDWGEKTGGPSELVGVIVPRGES